MSRPAVVDTCAVKLFDLRAIAKRLRETATFVDGLIPMDLNPDDAPKTQTLDYMTRGRSFQEGFAARDRKHKKGRA